MNEFQKAWKQLAAKKQLTSSDMAVLCLSKAVHEKNRVAKIEGREPIDALEQAKYYLKKSFIPISKPSKLANGSHPYMALYGAIGGVTYCESFKAFETLWGEAMRDEIKALASEIRGNRYGVVNL